MYEFWYDYIKPEYDKKNKILLCGYRQLHCSCKNIRDAETGFGTSNYEVGRPLSIGKNEKVIGLMKVELGGQIMKTFVGLRSKT